MLPHKRDGCAKTHDQVPPLKQNYLSRLRVGKLPSITDPYYVLRDHQLYLHLSLTPGIGDIYSTLLEHLLYAGTYAVLTIQRLKAGSLPQGTGQVYGCSSERRRAEVSKYIWLTAQQSVIGGGSGMGKLA